MHTHHHHTMSLWLAICLCAFSGVSANAALAAKNDPINPGHGQMTEAGYPIPGAEFRVYLKPGHGAAQGLVIDPALAKDAVETVVAAFTDMVEHRSQYPRFDKALTNHALKNVIIEPKVFNRFVKEFPFLVARTPTNTQTVLLISASRLQQDHYLHHPEKLIPRLEREFQWVLSKVATKPKPQRIAVTRDLQHTAVQPSRVIKAMTGHERDAQLQRLLETYLTTVDDYQSLTNQPMYETGANARTPPAQPDSTTKFYDIRVREALHILAHEDTFLAETPKAVVSILNGKIWNVAFVNIDSRDWATRTRVLPKDQAVTVGPPPGVNIQPAKVLINYHRVAQPEDPFYGIAGALPMGALTARQLAHVIAMEIEQNITDKSMRGHVAQDEQSAPRR